MHLPFGGGCAVLGARANKSGGGHVHDPPSVQTSPSGCRPLAARRLSPTRASDPPSPRMTNGVRLAHATASEFFLFCFLVAHDRKMFPYPASLRTCVAGVVRDTLRDNPSLPRSVTPVVAPRACHAGRRFVGRRHQAACFQPGTQGRSLREGRPL